MLANSSLGAPTTVANGTIDIGGNNSGPNPTLRYTGVAATGETTDRVLNFTFNGGANRTLDASGPSGLLKFTSSFTGSGGSTPSGTLILTGTGLGEISGSIPEFYAGSKVSKSGAGTWTLSGANGFTGTFTLSAGTINLNHAQALGTGAFTMGGNGTFDNTSGSAITISTNNAFNLSSGSPTFTGTNDLNLGTGTVTLSGANRTITVTNAGAKLTLGGVVASAGFNLTVGGGGILALTNEASTYTGQTIIGTNAASTLRLQVTKLANLSATSSLGAPTTAGTGLIQIGATSNPSTLELIGGTSASSTNRQVQIGSSSNGSGGATILNNNTNSAHTLTFSNAAFNVAATGVTSSSRSLTLGGSNTGDNTISGAIIPNTGGSGVTSLVKSGTGTWVIAGANTYQGNTAITDGILKAGANNTIPSGTGKGNVNLNGGASVAGTLDLNGFDLAINGLVGTSDTVLGRIVNNATGTNKTLEVGNNNASTTFAGIIADNTSGTGTVAVTKVGAGTQTLSATNTYTGATNVNAGTLLINGSTSVSSVVTVNGGTLGGSGTINGTVSVAAGATLSPGTSIESLVTGSLSMASTSNFVYEVTDNSSTGADMLGVSGALSLTGVNLDLTLANAALSGGGWTAGDKLTLISYFDAGSGITSGFTGRADDTSYFFGLNEWLFNYNDTEAGGNYATDAVAAGQNKFVTFTLVPEPSTALLTALGVLALLRRRR